MTAYTQGTPIRVLLIEDNPGDARLITEALRDHAAAPSRGPAFELACADRLSAGLARLADGSIDVVLLDLSLPDGSGLATLTRLHAHAPDVTVVVLTGLDDEELAVRAVREGAQDYLVKGQAESALLGRAIRYAVERAADQAERARLLERERAARAEAEAASRVKSQFLTTMSHELRTPLNAIVGYAQLMELGIAGPVTDAQRGYLERLRLSSTHLLGLVDEVLDLAEMGADRLTVVRELAVTGAAVRAALALTLPEATSRGVRVVDGSPVDPGSTYVGDEARVRQILVNLLSNAVKFTGRGGSVTLDCGTVAHAPPKALVCGSGPWTFIRVQDTGIGIAAEDQAAVFEPFHQVERGHTRTQGGTGLGLTISRRLARLMGGDLTLESTPGWGSAFTLWLPTAGTTARVTEGEAERADGCFQHGRALSSR